MLFAWHLVVDDVVDHKKESRSGRTREISLFSPARLKQQARLCALQLADRTTNHQVANIMTLNRLILIPIKIILAINLLQSLILLSNAVSLKSEEKTADLTLLINETLAINNKSIPENAQGKLTSIIKDEWTFDMVEYDLMEFLQDLSARYKLNNYTQENSVPKNHQQNDWPSLEAKHGATVTKINSTSLIDVKENSTSNVSNLKVSEPAKDSVTESLLSPIVSTSSKAVELNKTNQQQQPATPSPELASTSLASGDHEIAESSWQYGIFDRFTRPKSSTRPTTPEPEFTLGPDGKFDLRNFNSDECGLRIYDERKQYFIQESFTEPDSEATKELIQRRHRLPIPSSPVNHKKYQSSSSDQQQQQVGNFFERGDQVEEGKKKDTADAEKDAYDSYNKHHDYDNAPPSSDSVSDTDFNLASRRSWLQQQLGNTLQLLGFNGSSQSVAEYLNQTSGLSLNMRENMMKKSSLGKLGKSAGEASSDGSESKQQEQDLLNSRQDDMKLEARVIGGTDARLGDSPWSVSLQALVSKPGTGGVEYRHYCGGTIISEYYVLTAAHCLDFMVGRESRLFVVTGDLNWRMSTASLHGRRFGIDKLIIHSGYKSTAFGHDIGLIKTKESMRPLKVNGRYIVNSVCLPERNAEHTGEAELVGWGLFSNRNEMAESLQIADVPILPRPLCVDLYKRRTGLIQWLIGIELITDKQVCAGTFGRGICQGDSGSALVVNERSSSILKRKTRETAIGERKPRMRSTDRSSQQSRATIIGIVAFGGIRRCSYQSLPGVYMQTSKYMDWILPRIQQN